jgi:outer membrane protein assembly factor BamB
MRPPPGSYLLLGLSLLLTAFLVLALALPWRPPAPAPVPLPGPEDLWDAARQGDARRVEAVLKAGVDVNAGNSYGVTALALAAGKGHLAVVKTLLRRRANVNVTDSFYKVTPLTWAVMRGHADVTRALIEGGADAGGALPMAAVMGHADTVRAVLQTGKVKGKALDQALASTPARQAGIAELLQKAGARGTWPPPAVKVAAATLRSYAGAYRADSGDELTLALAGGTLTLRAAGRAPVALEPVNASTFRSADGKFTVQVAGAKGKTDELTVWSGLMETIYARQDRAGPTPPAVEEGPASPVRPANWPSFRGPGASGVADGQAPPATWDARAGRNVRWKTPLPGLGLSCPVVWGERVFVTTAVGEKGAPLRTGLYGDVEPVEDRSEHAWKVYCLDARTGRVVWERTARSGVPTVKRHPKSSHANSTPATDGKHLVAFFGSEGLYCYDLAGRLLWQKDLGVLAAGWFYDSTYEWGFGSSPVLYRDRVLIQCDVGKGSFLAAFRLADGQELWRTPRDEVPSWGSPTVVAAGGVTQVVTNATRFARGYDVETGKELWRLGPNSEITVPTPINGCGLIFVTSGYRPIQPIYAVRPGARGDLSPKGGATSGKGVAWSTGKGGPYLPTPLVYGEHLYVCSISGILTCYEARTGRQVYRQRVGGAYTASPVAADGRLYFTSEDGTVRVVAAGPRFRRLAANPLGEACLATPAISGGMLLFRTRHHIVAVGRPVLTSKR